jgi:hypothetical protein
MRTPYDGARRLRQREIDDLRLTIAARADEAATLRFERERLDAAAGRERDAAAAEPLMASHSYLKRLRAQRGDVARAGAEADVRLSEIRGQALSVFASMRVLEEAAESFRLIADRAAASAEQAAADDRYGARVANGAAAARRARAA